MKNKKISVKFLTIVLSVILFFTPSAIGKLIGPNQNKKIVEETDLIESIFPIKIGYFYIWSNGHEETAQVNAEAYNDIEIKVSAGGSNIKFKAEYEMYAKGMLDTAWATLSVEGAPVKTAETDDEDKGDLVTIRNNCKPGDIIYWNLTAVLDDWFFDIKDYDEGSGYCKSLPKYKRDKNLPVNLASSASSTNKRKFSISGKIICK